MSRLKNGNLSKKKRLVQMSQALRKQTAYRLCTIIIHKWEIQLYF